MRETYEMWAEETEQCRTCDAWAKLDENGDCPDCHVEDEDDTWDVYPYNTQKH